MTAFLIRIFSQIPENLDERRNDKNRARRAENQTREKPRVSRIFPDVESAERPVNSDRNHREKQPEARQRLDIVDFSQYRVDQKAEREPEINAETARADRKCVIFDVKRAPVDLVTDKAERLINSRRKIFETFRHAERREQDQ